MMRFCYLTIIAYTLVALTVLLIVQFPTDDGSCVQHTTPTTPLDCNYVYSALNSRQTKCAWDGETNSTDMSNSCVWSPKMYNPLMQVVMSIYIHPYSDSV